MHSSANSGHWNDSKNGDLIMWLADMQAVAFVSRIFREVEKMREIADQGLGPIRHSRTPVYSGYYEIDISLSN